MCRDETVSWTIRPYLFTISVDLCLVDSVEVGVGNISRAINVVQQELEGRELIVIKGTMVTAT